MVYLGDFSQFRTIEPLWDDATPLSEPSASNELDPSGAKVEGTALAMRRFLVDKQKTPCKSVCQDFFGGFCKLSQDRISSSFKSPKPRSTFIQSYYDFCSPFKGSPNKTSQESVPNAIFHAAGEAALCSNAMAWRQRNGRQAVSKSLTFCGGFLVQPSWKISV